MSKIKQLAVVIDNIRFGILDVAVIVTVSLLLASIVGSVVSLMLLGGRPDPQPVSFFWDDFNEVDVCPGDRVEYVIGIEAHMENGGALYVTSNIARRAEHDDVAAIAQLPIVRDEVERTGLPLTGDAVVFQRWGDVPVIVVPRPSIRVDLDAGFIIPDIGPGPYNRIIAVGTVGTSALEAVRVQPFTVKANCSEAETGE